MTYGVEVEGKTKDEAVEKALKCLKAQREDVEVEVLAVPVVGLLGWLMRKRAKVRVNIRREPKALAKWLVRRMLETAGYEKVSIQVSEVKKGVKVDIEDDVSVFIGRHGENINALECILENLLQHLTKQKVKVEVDVNRYRQKREETLRQLAIKTARKVITTGREINLGTMSAHDRRIVHTTLKSHPKVVTYSVGREGHRKLVVAPAKARGQNARNKEVNSTSGLLEERKEKKEVNEKKGSNH